jgi:hypothetical protein
LEHIPAIPEKKKKKEKLYRINLSNEQNAGYKKKAKQ